MRSRRVRRQVLAVTILVLACFTYLTTAMEGNLSSLRKLKDVQQAVEPTQRPIVVKTPSDIFPRLNIQRMIEDKELSHQLDLYIQAFLRIQERPASSRVSYFQMAAIHGQPYQAWDGVVTEAEDHTKDPEPLGGKQPGMHDRFAGYCWHASVLFPTWHRAYTLLMEQEIRLEAFEIAMEYDKSERKEYLEAAHQLRMPYWDWISEEAASQGLPGYVLDREVEVNTPDGRKFVRNPLESYTFPADVMDGNPGVERGSHGKQRIGYAPALGNNPTLRHPDINLQPQYDVLQEDLRSEIHMYVRPAWEKMYTDPEIAASWARFSTHRPRDDGLRPESNLKDLEGLHDLVHDVLGGIVFGGDFGYPGHASDVNVAAYDPLFFMHHANLDRMTAMYQRRNPDSWIEPTHERHVKNYMVGLNGHMTNSSTPLWPFRKTESEFYTSDDLREFTDLGYTYPEFLEELAELKARRRAAVQAPAPGVGLANPSSGLWVGSKVARFLKGTDRSSEEPWEHKHHLFEKSIWCPHSKLPWCGFRGRKDHEAPD